MNHICWLMTVFFWLLGWELPQPVQAQCDYNYYACDSISCCPNGYTCGTGKNGCASDQCCKSNDDSSSSSTGCSYGQTLCGNMCIPSGSSCCGGLGYCDSGTVCNTSNTGCISPNSSGSSYNPDVSYNDDENGVCTSITIPAGNGTCAVTACNRFYDNDTCSLWYVVNGKRFECGSCTSQQNIQSCAERAGSYCTGTGGGGSSGSSSSSDDDEEAGACRVSGTGTTQQATWMLCLFSVMLWRIRRRTKIRVQSVVVRDVNDTYKLHLS